MSGHSEDDLVSVLRRILSGDAPGVFLGPGDDAALVEMGPHLGILTVDMMVEDVHFDRRLVSPHDLGYKAVAVNVSDVAAMGGSPRYGLVALAIPADLPASWVVELYGGIREGADAYAMAVVGGDTSRAERIVVSVTVTGEVSRGAAVTRSGASPGDRIVVTGALGASAAGLRLATAPPAEVSALVSTDWGRDLVASHTRPVARVGEGQALASAGATAMIDLSDGLAKDLGRLCRESGVGARLSLASLPVAPGVREVADALRLDTLGIALGGGEDYELLATLPEDAVEPAATRLADRFATALTQIGVITEGPDLVAVGADGERQLEPQGWDHFAG